MTADNAGAGDPVSAPGSAPLLCATCGERIRPGRTTGGFTHVARLVASCDLDSDHPAVPAQAAGTSATVTTTRADVGAASGSSSPRPSSTS